VEFNDITAKQLSQLHRVVVEAAQASDDDSILATILSGFMPVIKAEIGAFLTYDPRSNKFDRKIAISGTDNAATETQFSQTVLREILSRQEAVLSFDTLSEDTFSNVESVVINEIHAILAFPLMVKGSIYGIMYFDSRTQRQAFTESNRQLLEFFRPLASLALEQMLRNREMESENVRLRQQLPARQIFPEIIGESAAMQTVFKMLGKVAPTDASIILGGENGVGKDLVAQAIHRASKRADAPFLAQYIGNIPQTILESELFGHARGAFTGASANKMGLFEAVSGGTLFLDEIVDMPMELQTALLRVLQNKEIKRLGENNVRKVDVRIIAASNRDIPALVKAGKFREDLYYRLNVMTIKIPSLRERPDDIPLLAEYFLKLENRDMAISQPAMDKLLRYSWPGNVRQLQNIIRRASIICESNKIQPDNIIFDDEQQGPFLGTLEEAKNKVIRERLEQFNGNRSKTAESLDVSLRYVQNKVKELGL
jgi:Nif-specific regulatory protein